MDRPGVINPNVTIVTIENNVQKVPTVWAEEAMEKIMALTPLQLLLTSPSVDPLKQALIREYEQKLRQLIFNTLHPLFRRAITAERMRSE